MRKADWLYQLGLDYYNGNGYTQDTDIAIDYLIKSSQLNHVQAKILSAELLFKQAENSKSIYFEDGYQLGSELMIEIFRQGNIEATLPYLLDNEIFNTTCTLEEMEEYYQKAFSLGYRETKFVLAKLLYKKGSFKSAEQLFLESIKEDISKESHLYLYRIYQSDAYKNEKKAFLQLKEAIKNGYMDEKYQEFLEAGKVLIHTKYVYSQFSIDRIKSQVKDVVEHCFYADQSFKKWLDEDKIQVRIYFDLKVKLLNASYEYSKFTSDSENFVYEPVELSEGYFNQNQNSDAELINQFHELKKGSGFFQSNDKDNYLALEFKDVFDTFGIKNCLPVNQIELGDNETDQVIQAEIRNDIKHKHPEDSKQLSIKLKKFNIYKTLVPSFDFVFNYNNMEYMSKKYLFDSIEWKDVFTAEKGDINYKTIQFDIDFPLSEEAYAELEKMKAEIPKYKKKRIYVIPLKLLSLIIPIWSLMILIENRFFDQMLYLETFNLGQDLMNRPLWHLGSIIILIGSYFLTRVKIYELSSTNLSEMIAKDPIFVLPIDTNQKHFQNQFRQIIIFGIIGLILYLASGFLPIIR